VEVLLLLLLWPYILERVWKSSTRFESLRIPGIHELSVLNFLMATSIEKIEMGGACSTYGGREMCVQGSGVET
jgi:hypothetical protein